MECLKPLGMPNKTVISDFNAIEDNNTLTHDTRSISKLFKKFLSKLGESLLIKLLKPPDKYNHKLVIQFSFNYSSILQLQLTFVRSALLKNKF